MKQLLLSLIMPPGLFIWPLLLALIFWRNRTRAFWLVFAALIMGWLLSAKITAKILGALLVSLIPEPIAPYADADAIVVLTNGIEHAGRYDWQPTRESFKRAAVALELQREAGLRVPVIISGGFTNGAHNPSEAGATLNYIDRNRAEITPVIIEDISTNTWESPQHVVPILRERGVDKVVLVTSELHMPRSLASYRARGVDPMPLPVSVLPRGKVRIGDFLPHPHGINDNIKTVYEYFGLVQYLLLGRIGWNDITGE